MPDTTLLTHLAAARTTRTARPPYHAIIGPRGTVWMDPHLWPGGTHGREVAEAPTYGLPRVPIAAPLQPRPAPCGIGPCAANAGHPGTCAEASGRASAGWLTDPADARFPDDTGPRPLIDTPAWSHRAEAVAALADMARAVRRYTGFAATAHDRAEATALLAAHRARFDNAWHHLHTRTARPADATRSAR